MTWPSVPPHWRARVLGGAVVGALGYVAAVLLDFDPQPVAFVAMVAIACTMAWLIIDIVDVPTARWLSGLPTPGDRVDEATSDLRILSSHQQSSEPSAAVRDRLVALARARDPALAEVLHDELTPSRRLSPADIDRILTRIEEARDRS